MDVKIFNSLAAYFDVYSSLAKKSKSKNDLLLDLTNQGAVKSTAKSHVAKVVSGDLDFITSKNGLFCFEPEPFKEMITEICVELGLDVSFEEVHKKKAKPEDSIATVTVAHSPEYIKAKQAADSATTTIKELTKELEKRDAQIAALALELEKNAVANAVIDVPGKRLVVGTARFKPDGVFGEDFFTNDNTKLLDVTSLLSRFGNETPVTASDAEELSEENYLKRIARVLFGGNLLKNMLKQKELPQEADASYCDYEKKRLESVNQILKADNLPNQVKLSLYAQWFNGDSEMQQLLDYAGEHCINANYVIRLMEKPKEYQNFKTLRGMMIQAMKASEAHIKKEAALELIAGEWYVEAEYDGQMTRFRMVPDSALERIKNTSLQYHGENLVKIIDQLLLENKGFVKPSHKETERLCVNSSNQIKDIKVPVFVHAADGDVDIHIPVNEDAALDDFAEEKSDGEN